MGAFDDLIPSAAKIRETKFDDLIPRDPPEIQSEIGGLAEVEPDAEPTPELQEVVMSALMRGQPQRPYQPQPSPMTTGPEAPPPQTFEEAPTAPSWLESISAPASVAMPAPTRPDVAADRSKGPLPFDLEAAQAAYEEKSLGEVTMERLHSGTQQVGAGLSFVKASNTMEELAILDEAERLEAAGASLEDFAALQGRSSRFSLAMLTEPGLRAQARDNLARQLGTAVTSGAEAVETMQGIPRSPIADAFYAELSANGFSETAGELFRRDPLGIIGQTATETAPNALVTVGGGLVGGPAVAGAAGFGLERGASIQEVLGALGADLTDPQSILTALSDPETRAAAEEYAAQRGIPIAIFDALSMGLASAMAKKPVTNLASQLVVEPVTEGAGEAAAGLSSKGEIDLGDVVAETLGGLGTAVPQAGATSGAALLRQALTRTPQIQQVSTGQEPSPVPPAQEAPVAPQIPTAPAQVQQPTVEVPPTPPAPVETPPVAQPAVEPKPQAATYQPLPPDTPKANLVKIPPRFWQDRQERDLPMPHVVRADKGGYYVDPDDPAMSDLESDADYYATAKKDEMDGDLGGLIASSRATIRSIQNAKAARAARAEDVPPGTPPAPQEAPAASEVQGELTVASMRRTRSIEEGAVTHVTLSDGREIPISRHDAAGSFGIGGWHRNDLPPNAQNVPQTYLGDTRAQAIETLLARENEKLRRQREEEATQAPTETPIEPVAQDDGVEWASIGGEVMANSPDGQLLSVRQEGNEWVATSNGQEVGRAASQAEAQTMAVTEGARIAGEAREKAQKPPVETPLGRSQRIEQSMREGKAREPELTDTLRAAFRKREAVADDDTEGFLAATDEVKAARAALAAAVGEERAKAVFQQISDEIPDAGSQRDPIQQEVDSLVQEQTDRVNSTRPVSKEDARDRFNRDMDELASMLESRGLTEDAIEDGTYKGEVPTIRYTLRRPSGETRYTISQGTAEGVRAFKKRMGQSLPVDLGNTPGGAKAPITVEQFIADNSTRRVDGQPIKPRDVTDEEIEALSEELGRPLKRGDKIEFASQPKPKNQPKSKSSPALKFSDAATAAVQDDNDSQPEPKTTGRTQPRGTLGPTFVDFSFTNRNSVFEAAFRAAGLDPDQARLLSTDEQIEKLRQVITQRYGIRIALPTMKVGRKTITGRKVAQERRQIGDRDAIDQLLDAYRQLEMMAHVMGIPHRGLALTDSNGRSIVLSLRARLKGALGMYSYDPETGERIIFLPGRSNSFAHEWGHALDHWLALHLFKDRKDVVKLLSMDMHDDGVPPAETNSENIARAMVRLMQAMFGDRAKLAAMQIDLTQRAAATDKDGNPTPDAKSAQKLLTEIEQGKKPPVSVLTKYFENAAQFDQIFNAGGYFQSPHEMLARAFETYIGVRVAAVSDLPGGFLSKPSWAYTGSEELRAKMTFPREGDAVQIFAAFDNLASELATKAVWGDDKAKRPEDADVYDQRMWDRWQPRNGLLAREKEVWSAALKAKRERNHGPSAMRKTLDAVSYFASTFQGYLRSIAARQETPEARRALQNVLDHFMTDPGSGRAIKEVWEEAVEARAKRNTTRLENIIRNFNLHTLSDDENAELRRLLTVPGAKAKTERLGAAAASLRRYMDDIWRYIDGSGIKIGYTRNGFLPRILDTNAMMENPQGFREAATKVYRQVFRRDVTDEPDLDTQISDMKKIVRQLMRAKRPTEEGDEIMRDLIGSDQAASDAVTAWMDARKKLSRLNSKLKAAVKSKDEDKIAEAQAKVDEFMENDFMPVHEALLEELERVYATERADNWFHRVMAGNAMDFDTKGPSTTFTKKRELPAEADAILADFYQSDVLTLVQDYAQMAPRRAEYVKRAGVNSEKLENMLEAAVRAGASTYDVKEIRRSINMLTGRQTGLMHSQSQWLGGWSYVAATVTLLERAFYSSLAEPLAAGIRTGNAADSLRAFASTVAGLVRTKKTKQLGELARVIGLITAAEHETIMLNRYGGDIDPTRAQGKVLANFFRYTHLTQLTNLQRRQMLVVADAFIRRHLRKSAKGNARSIGELADLGIPESAINDLRDWLESVPGIPTADDMLGVDGDYFNRAASIYGQAASRLVQQVIQNPKRFTRPGAAIDSRFRALYGITGFIFSFHANILLPLFKKGIAPKMMDEGPAHYAARRVLGSTRNISYALPAIASLYMGQMLAYVLRTAIFNPEKFDEFEDDDEMYEWLIAQAFTRSGLMGAWDIPYNLLTGLKYGTDLAGLYAGPHTRFHFDRLEDVLMLGIRNSEKTEKAERKAVAAAAELVLHTGGNLAISALPGGPLLAAAYGVGINVLSASSPGEMFADAMYPEDEDDD